MLDPELRSQAIVWAEHDPDPATTAALTGIIARAEVDDAAAIAELTSMFAGPLQFGTAGLRAELGPGPARMNRVVVGRAAKGLADWLVSQGLQGSRVIIGHDARYNSDVFARDSAEIIAASGFEVLLTDRPVPTPVLAFGIRHYSCVAGIVVTASHNPPNDNGYKVYLGDGSQIVPPVDTQIAECIAAVADVPFADIAKGEDVTMLGDELTSAYLDRAFAVIGEVDTDLTWAYTAMHGVGSETVRRAVSRCGLPMPHVVEEQDAPDPAFPTVAFPNPEEPGAIDRAVALATSIDADLVIANDPDADRCAAAVAFPDENGEPTWRMLTGDELGTLIGDDYLRRRVPGTYANSVVSSTLLSAMAATHGATHETTLTGFKWIGRVPHLAFGYEEAIGYCCDPDGVADKDGITALLTILRIAADLKAAGSSIPDRLDEIAASFGVYATSQLSARVDDLQIIVDAMARLRANPPQTLLGQATTVTDLAAPNAGLPPTDAVLLETERARVVVRPSGTEPKLKCYLQAVVPADQVTQRLPAARADAAAMLGELRSEMETALGL